MSKRFQWTWLRPGFALALSIQLSIAATAPAEGYLQRIGPTPLRMRAEASVTQPVVLPPLPMSDDVPGTTPTQSGLSGAPLLTPLASTEIAPQWPTWEWLLDQALETASQAEPPKPQETLLLPRLVETPVVTPQMLVEFFKPTPAATNAPAITAVAPVGFTPPTPTVGDTSRATYRIQ